MKTPPKGALPYRYMGLALRPICAERRRLGYWVPEPRGRQLWSSSPHTLSGGWRGGGDYALPPAAVCAQEDHWVPELQSSPTCMALVPETIHRPTLPLSVCAHSGGGGTGSRSRGLPLSVVPGPPVPAARSSPDLLCAERGRPCRPRHRQGPQDEVS